jgi:hypothetical protein
VSPSNSHRDSHEVFRKRCFFLHSRARYRNVIFSSGFFFIVHFFYYDDPPLCNAPQYHYDGQMFRNSVDFFSDFYIFFLRTTFLDFFLLDPVDPHRIYTTARRVLTVARPRHMWGKITFFCISSKQKCFTHRFFFHGSCHYWNCYYWWTFWKHIKKKETVNIYTIAAFVLYS